MTNINRPTYVTKTFYSPKNYEQVKSMSGHVTATSVTQVNQTSIGSGIWSSNANTKAFNNKEPKDKTYLFKSQKYIRDFKSTTLNPNSKKEEEKLLNWVQAVQYFFMF